MERLSIYVALGVIPLVLNFVRGNTIEQSESHATPGGAQKSVDQPRDTRKAQHSKQAAETVVIPLAQISGNVSSESKPLRSLEPEFFIYRDTPEKIEKYNKLSLKELQAIAEKANDSFTLPIEGVMRTLSATKQQKPRAGFAVKGNGREALKGVFDVLVKKQKASEEFSTQSDVSAVFLSYLASPAVAFEQVERTGTRVKIRYMLITRATADAHWHLAIIPLGKLPSGTYHVELIRSPKEGDHNPPGYPSVPNNVEQRIVCQPFQFVVKEER